MKRLLALAVLSVASVVGAASCGLGGDDQLQSIGQEDLLGLDETTTSTSSTTTLPPTAPVVVESSVVATSTTIAAESVKLFFVDGTRLQPITVPLAGTASPRRVIEALLNGLPEGEIGIGLRTLLPPGLVNDVDAPGTGEAAVDLASEPFNQIDPTDQRTAIGQIVMTLVNRPGIGQVTFSLDGTPQRVPRRDGLQSEPGERVSLIDYESLLHPIEEPTTTTTTVPALPPNAPPTTRP